jgi:hypothetical protein
MIVFFFCYIPWWQTVIDTTQVPVEYFFLPVAFGIILLTLEEIVIHNLKRWLIDSENTLFVNILVDSLQGLHGSTSGLYVWRVGRFCSIEVSFRLSHFCSP